MALPLSPTGWDPSSSRTGILIHPADEDGLEMARQAVHRRGERIDPPCPATSLLAAAPVNRGTRNWRFQHLKEMQ